ncbi:putative Peptidase A2 domain-containing protein [Seiridium cardinale]
MAPIFDLDDAGSQGVSQGGISHETPEHVTTRDGSSSLDDRSSRVARLPNQLEASLAHDAETNIDQTPIPTDSQRPDDLPFAGLLAHGKKLQHELRTQEDWIKRKDETAANKASAIPYTAGRQNASGIVRDFFESWMPERAKRSDIWPRPIHEFPSPAKPPKFPGFPGESRRKYDQYISQKRSILPVILNGRKEYAIPDTGVSGNVMTRELATSLGAAIDQDPAKQYRFKNATKCHFQSSGIASLRLSFPDDPGRTWDCDFAIVEKCAAPMTLGKAFLDATEVFTRFSHRLTKGALHMKRTIVGGFKKIWKLMLMENARQKLGCQIDGDLVFAIADSGSDIDLVSREYAQFRGWDITTLPDDEGFVMLANEDIVKLTGYIETSLSIGGKSALRRFYVLDDLVNDVVLGDETLNESQVFTMHKESFVDVLDHEEDRDFCMIEWVEKFNEVEEKVDEMLSGQIIGMVQPQESPQRKKRWTFGRNVASSVDAKCLKQQLRHRLDEADNIETDCRTFMAKKFISLSGEALEKETELDQRRRERHKQLRQKIIREIEKFSRVPQPTA